MSKKIVITISESAEIEIETSGFKGKSCEQATKAILDSLGATKSSSKKKPEYYQENENRIHN